MEKLILSREGKSLNLKARTPEEFASDLLSKLGLERRHGQLVGVRVGEVLYRCQSIVTWQQGGRRAGPGVAPALQTRTAKAWSQGRQALATPKHLDPWARFHPQTCLHPSERPRALIPASG